MVKYRIYRSIATAGAGGLLISPSSDTCFLILDSAVSCRVPISGHLAEEPTSSKWPRNLGGKPQPRRQSLAKSWLKAENFRGRGDSGAMNFLQCGQSDQETRPQPESGASRSRSGGNVEREGKAETIRAGAAAVVKLLERCCNPAVTIEYRLN